MSSDTYRKPRYKEVCGNTSCNLCYETVIRKPRKPRVKKITVPVISQETVDALMKRGTPDFKELMSMDTLIDVDPDTVYAKDTYLENGVYVDAPTLTKRK